MTGRQEDRQATGQPDRRTGRQEERPDRRRDRQEDRQTGGKACVSTQLFKI